ncbi:hypothetical protein RB623_11605 [Mesorhizobium sp. LHD-90]|uniref:hypothetical protein n=1 Tax=Mesorhizobium sp. LHD-90 TaxID=3071414 RepID=UPI0027DFD3B2|nr:hypothetical protein [Mesorhizobium sp. LHD-90]MDQ6434690.1 hypothetical protein [Mesorhizobium sp. LHD-90]
MRKFLTLLSIGVAAGALASCATVEDAVLAPLKYANGQQASAVANRRVQQPRQVAAPRQQVATPKKRRVLRKPVAQPVQDVPVRERGGDGGGGGPSGGGWGGG